MYGGINVQSLIAFFIQINEYWSEFRYETAFMFLEATFGQSSCFSLYEKYISS